MLSSAYECPEGQSYKARGATPVATCLNQNPTETGKVRGCFCPAGEFLQDGVCVAPSECKCLHEGIFYKVRSYSYTAELVFYLKGTPQSSIVDAVVNQLCSEDDKFSLRTEMQ